MNIFWKQCQIKKKLLIISFLGLLILTGCISSPPTNIFPSDQEKENNNREETKAHDPSLIEQTIGTVGLSRGFLSNQTRQLADTTNEKKENQTTDQPETITDQTTKKTTDQNNSDKKSGESLPAGWTELSDFIFPFEISTDDLNNSTMFNGQPVILKDPDPLWASQIEEINIANGWQMVNQELYFDGGSHREVYFLVKREPMVDIFSQWNMTEGKVSQMSIKLIHPADVAATLIDIRGQKAMMLEIFNIEELLDCPGTVGPYQNGVYACIGDNNEVIEWY